MKIQATSLGELSRRRVKPAVTVVDLEVYRQRGIRDFYRGISVAAVPYSDPHRAKAWEEGFRVACKARRGPR